MNNKALLRLYYTDLCNEIYSNTNWNNSELYNILRDRGDALGALNRNAVMVYTYPAIRALKEKRIEFLVPPRIGSAGNGSLEDRMRQMIDYIDTAKTERTDVPKLVYFEFYADTYTEDIAPTTHLDIALSRFYEVANDLIDATSIIRTLWNVDPVRYCAAYIDPKTRNVYVIAPTSAHANFTRFQAINIFTLVYATMAPAVITDLQSEAFVRLAEPLQEFTRIKNSLTNLGSTMVQAEQLYQPFTSIMEIRFNEMFETPEMQEILLDYLLQSFENAYDAQINQQITDLDSKYNRKYVELVELAEQLFNTRLSTLAVSAPKEKIQALYNILLQQPNFTIIDRTVSNGTIQFDLDVKSKMHFDPVFLQQSMIQRNDRQFKLLTAFYEEKIEIYFKQRLRINISRMSDISINRRGEGLPNNYYLRNKEPATYPNTHINRANCLGSFRHEITNAFKNEVYTMIALLIKDSVGNINLADGAIYPTFVSDILMNNDATVFNTETQEFCTIGDFLDPPKPVVVEEPIPVAPEPQSEVVVEPEDINIFDAVEETLNERPTRNETLHQFFRQPTPTPILGGGEGLLLDGPFQTAWGVPIQELTPELQTALHQAYATEFPTIQQGINPNPAIHFGTDVNNMPVQTPTLAELRTVVLEMRDNLTHTTPRNTVIATPGLLDALVDPNNPEEGDEE